ncbi:HPF/RaiA family ribosome-associated protein [Myxococcota bacterium]|nr:HPF/RaiA family ribosome-associated protein [Myxococcota bacterium]
MQRPPTITWRNVDHDPETEADVRRHIAQLDRVHPRLTGVDVMVERPHHSQGQGNLFRVRIDVHVPGDELVVNRDPREHHAREDLHVAIRDAFKAVRRQLRERGRVMRGEVKDHEEMAVGTVRTLSDEGGGYGFLVTPEGREVYFHHNAVKNATWEDVEVGAVVRFQEELGQQGAQAAVVLID